MDSIFKGYIDESYNPRYFALSCLFAKGLNWMWFLQDWESVLRAKNAELEKEARPRISRFHATYCSTGYGEFSDWPPDERIALTKELLKVFDKPSNSLTVSSYAVNLKDLTEIMPQSAGDSKALAYSLLLKFVMVEIGNMFAEANKGDTSNIKITLVHDRCAYNGVLQTAFDGLLNDETFRFKSIFTNLDPMGWEDCLALQPADLIAYENCKEADRQGLRPDMDMRRSLQYLLGPNSTFNGRSKGFLKENIEQLKRLMDARTSAALKAHVE